MTKKIVTILAMIICLLLFCGCGRNEVNASTENNHHFTIIDSQMIGGNWLYTVYDNNNKVVYTFGKGELSPLYNTSGTPMTLDEYNRTK